MMLATVSSVYPGFLVGALAVQMRDEFGVSEARYGWGLGSFFLASTLGSVALGHLAQRVGPRRQLQALLAIGALMQLCVAAFVDGFGSLVALLVACGLVNAGNQTAVNLALAEARLPRLGMAVALKQSGMPAASLLSGLAVPTLALTVGWRWAFVGGAGLNALTLVMVTGVVGAQRSPGPARAAELVTSRRSLRLAALSGALMSFGAGAINAWLVASAVDAGLGEGSAGVLLGLGAASGIAMRLYSGTRLDSMHRPPFQVGGATALVGAVAIAALGPRLAPLQVVMTFVAFASGWIWPVFTNFAIIRRNPDAAGAATGTTQMGVYVGVFSAPLITGAIISSVGYGVMWSVVAASVATGSVIAILISSDF